MKILSASERERAWTAFSTYVLVKTGGHVEETAIYERVSQALQKHGHEGFSSAEEMCEDFKKWGLPDWAYPAEMKPKKTRKARTVTGKAEELPPFANAATHLRETIHTLEDPYLEHMKSLKETLQGNYFVSEGETDKPSAREVRGAQWHPHPYEVILIAVSILERLGNWGHVERLLKELHPRPAEANRQLLVRYIYGRRVDDKGNLQKPEGDGLLDRAKQIAVLIRGGTEVKRGRKTPAIPSIDQLRVLWVRNLVDTKGYSREKVAREFREDWERDREHNLQYLRDELKVKRAERDHTGYAEVEQEIRTIESQKYDEGDFNRIWDLAKYFTN